MLIPGYRNRSESLDGSQRLRGWGGGRVWWWEGERDGDRLQTESELVVHNVNTLIKDHKYM